MPIPKRISKSELIDGENLANNDVTRNLIPIENNSNSNYLHANNRNNNQSSSIPCSSTSTVIDSNSYSAISNGDNNGQSSLTFKSNPENDRNTHGDGQNVISTCYQPILNSQQNPLYFESNRILFEAHRSRLQRQMIKTTS